MMAQRKVPRIARWGVPAGAVALTGVVVAGFAMSGAQAAPSLPSRTPVQLLAAVNSARRAAADDRGGPGIGGPRASPACRTSAPATRCPRCPGCPARTRSRSGTRTRRTCASRSRCSSASPMSAGTAATSGTGTARPTRPPTWCCPRAPRLPRRVIARHLPPRCPTRSNWPSRVLAAVGPTTRVGLQQNVSIAGQPAYQISLAPKDSRSLIGQIRIAIDAQRALPLRVQIFARGSSSPAFQVGFTSLQFGTPAAGNFAFTAPPGAKVKTVTVPAGAGPGLLRRLPLGPLGIAGALAGVPRHAVVRLPAPVKGKQVILKAIGPAALQRTRAVMIGRALALKGLPEERPGAPDARPGAPLCSRSCAVPSPRTCPRT